MRGLGAETRKMVLVSKICIFGALFGLVPCGPRSLMDLRTVAMATDQARYGTVRFGSGSRFHLDTAPVGEIIIDSSLPAAPVGPVLPALYFWSVFKTRKAL